ncbi:hypothetical protein GPECTOR_97g768 [Gonium pectorale]|uniref:Uncharacterized protein n=1 Tax=Gonium pectorale TaxID=33097 RepID=A0A150G1Q9_GONPE|nr:hypothetical protein GPECTOR_97g768 [Gonium pectorale]|eukprot:KXZ43230.1 hypothetical protein GPECTOR_97g768 [Gonium pectorale]
MVVQKVVHAHHKDFLEASRGLQDVEALVDELRNYVSSGAAVVANLADLPPLPKKVPLGSHLQLSALDGDGGTGRPQPATAWEAILALQAELIQDLQVAVAEQDFALARALLQAGRDMIAVVERDAAQLADQVGGDGLPGWRAGLEAALTAQKAALVEELTRQLGRTNSSTVERRNAAQTLGLLVGPGQATRALLHCHTLRVRAAQQQLLQQHSAAGGDPDGVEYAGGLAQRTFLAIGTAAEDVRAVFPAPDPEPSTRSTAPTASAAPTPPDAAAMLPSVSALVVQWAADEAGQCAELLRRHALTPFVATGGGVGALLCAGLALVFCGALELSHGLALRAVFQQELWPPLEAIVRRHLHRLREEAAASASLDATNAALKAVASLAAAAAAEAGGAGNGPEGSAGADTGGGGGGSDSGGFQLPPLPALQELEGHAMNGLELRGAALQQANGGAAGGAAASAPAGLTALPMLAPELRALAEGLAPLGSTQAVAVLRQGVLAAFGAVCEQVYGSLSRLVASAGAGGGAGGAGGGRDAATHGSRLASYVAQATEQLRLFAETDLQTALLPLASVAGTVAPPELLLPLLAPLSGLLASLPPPAPDAPPEAQESTRSAAMQQRQQQQLQPPSSGPGPMDRLRAELAAEQEKREGEERRAREAEARDKARRAQAREEEEAKAAAAEEEAERARRAAAAEEERLRRSAPSATALPKPYLVPEAAAASSAQQARNAGKPDSPTRSLGQRKQAAEDKQAAHGKRAAYGKQAAQEADTGREDYEGQEAAAAPEPEPHRHRAQASGDVRARADAAGAGARPQSRPRSAMRAREAEAEEPAGRSRGRIGRVRWQDGEPEAEPARTQAEPAQPDAARRRVKSAVDLHEEGNDQADDGGGEEVAVARQPRSRSQPRGRSRATDHSDEWGAEPPAQWQEPPQAAAAATAEERGSRRRRGGEMAVAAAGADVEDSAGAGRSGAPRLRRESPEAPQDRPRRRAGEELQNTAAAAASRWAAEEAEEAPARPRARGARSSAASDAEDRSQPLSSASPARTRLPRPESAPVLDRGPEGGAGEEGGAAARAARPESRLRRVRIAEEPEQGLRHAATAEEADDGSRPRAALAAGTRPPEAASRGEERRGREAAAGARAGATGPQEEPGGAPTQASQPSRRPAKFQPSDDDEATAAEAAAEAATEARASETVEARRGARRIGAAAQGSSADEPVGQPAKAASVGNKQTAGGPLAAPAEGERRAAAAAAVREATSREAGNARASSAPVAAAAGGARRPNRFGVVLSDDEDEEGNGPGLAPRPRRPRPAAAAAGAAAGAGTAEPAAASSFPRVADDEEDGPALAPRLRRARPAEGLEEAGSRASPNAPAPARVARAEMAQRDEGRIPGEQVMRACVCVACVAGFV